MNVTFHKAEINDLQKIVATYNASIPGRLATADLEPVSVESKVDWFNQHSKANRPLYIIELDSEYAGWLSFSDFYGRPAYSATAEVSIYIEPFAQGKGLGNHCLQYAINQCKELQITTLLGFIFGHNEPSLKLFYKHGFEKWAHLPQIANMQGALRDLIIVGKKV